MLLDERDGLVTAAGLPDDLVALLLEDLLEVEADDRFVLGDNNADGHLALRNQPAQEVVLDSLEIGDRRR